MACVGRQSDYRCRGWIALRQRILKRDGFRCRGCNRGGKNFRLEVHHRVYGYSGACGSCVLTGISDEDLTTLCFRCHDAVTNVRKRLGYSKHRSRRMTLTGFIRWLLR